MEIVFDQSFMNVLQGGYEGEGGVVWVHEHFISDGNGFDFCGWEVIGDVLLDPCVGK